MRGVLTASGMRCSWMRCLAPLALLVALLAPSGCAFFPHPQTTIHGRIYGMPFVKAASGPHASASQPQPVRATVRCNNALTTAAADGSYSLAVDQTSKYTCTISAPPNYVSVVVTIASSAGNTVTLDIGSAAASASSCASPVAAPSATCAPLQLRPATINGKVTSADTQQAVSGANVSCWQPGASHVNLATFHSMTTGADGAFTFTPVSPGPYACHAGADSTLYQGTVDPGGTASVAMQVCAQRCPAVRYHNGAVMHDMVAYLLFWLPKGHSFEPSGSDKRFESLMAQYMTDIGGTPFYGLLTQYWDFSGSVVNHLTLGGTYVDTTAYPHAGTRSDPLSSYDIEHEIDVGIGHNHWTVDGEHEVFLYTGYNVESCAYSSSGKDCSFSNNGKHYCAYHSYFSTSHAQDNAIYAYVPVLADCVQIPELATYGSPNHDSIADATINSMSHEHFESVSDPHTTGWFDGTPDRGEIGDKCEYHFGAIFPGGGNVTLAHGHTYLLQEEWSDRVNACAMQ